MVRYEFAQVRADYARRWVAMIITPPRLASIDAMARKIIAGKARYQAVETDTGVPWAVVGLLHSREAGCNFNGILHNGEKIIGSGRKTKDVPAGRGPFASWHEAAIDAIAVKGWNRRIDWSVDYVLYACELFNGWGYRLRGVPSAYLWAGTDQYVRGKFVADHVWSATAVDQQIGVAPIMKRLLELDTSVSFGSAPMPVSMAPASVAIDPSDGLDPGEIMSLQQRLRDLGYAEVGQADGLWGPRTTAGVAAFQATLGLPVTGALDTATAAALATAPPRPISTERASMTASRLKAQGDAVVKATGTLKTIAAGVAGPTAVVGILDQLGSATDKLSLLRMLLGEVPGWIWAAIVVAVSVSLWLVAQRAETAKLDAVRTGCDAGPV